MPFCESEAASVFCVFFRKCLPWAGRFPMPVIEAARAGDAEAVERVLRYYEGYINKLCTRTLYDEYGYPYLMCRSYPCDEKVKLSLG